MPNIAFRLEDSGFSREQIEALTDFTEGNVASKADMVRLDGRIKSVQNELKTDIERLDGTIENVRSELKVGIGDVKADVANVQGQLKIAVMMTGATFIAVMTLVLKAFFAGGAAGG